MAEGHFQSADIFCWPTFKNHISHTNMNSWTLLRKKSHKYGTFGPSFRMGISNQWSLCGSLLRTHRHGFSRPPAHHLTCFTFSHRLCGPWWIWVWRPWITHCLQSYNCIFPFLFPLASFLLSPGSANSLISIVPKELITSSFPIFFPLFQLNHSPFLPLPPSHPTTSLSQKLEIVFIKVNHEARLSPKWTVMTCLLERLHLNRYLNSLHIFTSNLPWCLYGNLIWKFRE